MRSLYDLHNHYSIRNLYKLHNHYNVYNFHNLHNHLGMCNLYDLHNHLGVCNFHDLHNLHSLVVSVFGFFAKPDTPKGVGLARQYNFFQMQTVLGLAIFGLARHQLYDRQAL